MVVNQRILQVVDGIYKGSKAAFAKDLGLSPAAIYKMLDRESGPSFKVIEHLIAKNKVSARWLILGEGSMFETGISNEQYESLEEENNLLNAKLARAEEKNRIFLEMIVMRSLLTDEERKRLLPEGFDAFDPANFGE